MTMLQQIKTSYTGGKSAEGVYQKIINLMPPHRVYVEAFLGGGSILRTKRPAEKNIGIEVDGNVILDRWIPHPPGIEIWQENAIDVFHRWKTAGKPEPGDQCLIYCDPPYLQSVRRSKRPLYRHELTSEAEHSKLLEVLKSLKAMVMISGYRSELYDRILRGWRRIDFTGQTRGGPRTESVWLNFPEPAELHDYRFLGDTYRERQDLKRKRARWLNRLERLPSQERFMLLSAIAEFRNDRTVTNAGTRVTAETPLTANSGISADNGSEDLIAFLRHIDHLQTRYKGERHTSGHLFQTAELIAARDAIGGPPVECDCYYCNENKTRSGSGKNAERIRKGKGA